MNHKLNNQIRIVKGLLYFQANQNTLILRSKIFQFEPIIKETLLSLANAHESGTSRICLHANTSMQTQNMILCILPYKNFRRHYHPSGKNESYTILLGHLFVDIFNEEGKLCNTLRLNSLNTPYMHAGGQRHMPYTKSKMCIYQEVYHGSFDKNIDVINF